MLTKRTDIILRKLVAFVNITADLADKTFLSLGLRLGLDVFLIIRIRHGFSVGNNPGFGDFANEHSVCSEVYVIFYFERHERIDVFRKKNQSVIASQGLAVGKFIYTSAALESEYFKDLEGSVYAQTVNVHNSRLPDDMVGIVLLIDDNGNSIRLVRDLCDGVDDKTVIFFTVVARNDVKTVSEIKEGGEVVFYWRLHRGGQYIPSKARRKAP